MKTFEEFLAYAKEHPEEAKKEFETALIPLTRTLADMNADHQAWCLYSDGFIKEDRDALNVCGTGLFSEGNHYVYIWRHENGDPFYVGSGKNGRSKATMNRPVDFYGELMALDAVLCYVADGVSEKDARFIEHYCSFRLSAAGVNLTNKDGVVSNMSERTAAKRKREYQKEADKLFSIDRRLNFLLNKEYKVPENRGEVLTRFWKKYGTLRCMDWHKENYEKAMETLSRKNVI